MTDKKSIQIHYGPIYGRNSGETMALCKPVGSFATMSNSWDVVTCQDCISSIRSSLQTTQSAFVADRSGS